MGYNVMAGVTGMEENVVIIGNLYARLFSYECVHYYIGMLGREINGNSGWLVSSGDGGRVVGRPSYGRESCCFHMKYVHC